MSIRVGTRGSKLALAQTSIVCKKLASHGIDTEQVIITTQGDTTTGVPLHEIGGQGVFVRALDDAILGGNIDCAVHSMKDIPAYRPSGIVTAAVLKRDSPADYLAYLGSLHGVKVIRNLQYAPACPDTPSRSGYCYPGSPGQCRYTDPEDVRRGV